MFETLDDAIAPGESGRGGWALHRRGRRLVGRLFSRGNLPLIHFGEEPLDQRDLSLGFRLPLLDLVPRCSSRLALKHILQPVGKSLDELFQLAKLL
ncbi:MAG: hypothetical protein U0992_17125 [Planctomycetaceae bacterium]